MSDVTVPGGNGLPPSITAGRRQVGTSLCERAGLPQVVMARLVRRGASIAGPVAPVSWPGCGRPSAPFSVSAPPVVVGRAKPGHDTGEQPRPYFAMVAP